jgi:hypothetical protein
VQSVRGGRVTGWRVRLHSVFRTTRHPIPVWTGILLAYGTLALGRICSRSYGSFGGLRRTGKSLESGGMLSKNSARNAREATPSFSRPAAIGGPRQDLMFLSTSGSHAVLSPSGTSRPATVAAGSQQAFSMVRTEDRCSASAASSRSSLNRMFLRYRSR